MAGGHHDVATDTAIRHREMHFFVPHRPLSMTEAPPSFRPQPACCQRWTVRTRVAPTATSSGGKIWANARPMLKATALRVS